MSSLSRADVRGAAVGTPVRGDVGYLYAESKERMAKTSSLTREEVRAGGRASDTRLSAIDARRARSRSRHRSRPCPLAGQSIVEFALVSLLLVTLTFGVIELGGCQ